MTVIIFLHHHLPSASSSSSGCVRSSPPTKRKKKRFHTQQQQPRECRVDRPGALSRSNKHNNKNRTKNQNDMIHAVAALMVVRALQKIARGSFKLMTLDKRRGRT
jgi:hypothetical protein